MAAPIADKIILPNDSGNTGKKVRTQTRVVGADTVHEHFFIPESRRSRLGIYYAASGTLTIPTAAQNGTTTGLFWLYNPIGSAVRMAVRRIAAQIAFAVTTAVDVSLPRLALSLVTFTGTGSGTLITPAKRASIDAAAVGNLRTASTGLAVTLGAMIKSDFPPINPTATSATIQAHMPPTIPNDWDPPEEEQPILLPGEGIVCWSADASTTANRRLSTDVVWEEFEP
jgi:hypothetical protein